MLKAKKVLLVVTGGISAYKAPSLVRSLVKAGAEVRCVLSAAAKHFVAETALRVVSGYDVSSELFSEQGIPHIDLARWADLVLVAPATANFMAKASMGLGDELATTLLLATRAQVLMVPAMNTVMLEHPATQANIRILRARGVEVLSPDSGDLACREHGAGRQPDEAEIVEAVRALFLPKPLKGQRVLVAAGPTRAYLDPVRFISNPSSGKMGVAMARAAWLLGAKVTLVAGPGVTTTLSPEVEVIGIERVEDLQKTIFERVAHLDWIVMAAAVGDWRAKIELKSKRKKSSSSDELWQPELVRSTDILKTLGQWRSENRDQLRLVGFAAETHDLYENAKAKLASKGADVILGNWVRSRQGDTFNAAAVELHAFGHGWTEVFGPDLKEVVALKLWPVLLEHL